MLKSNTSGYKGVNFNKVVGKWCASYSINNRHIHIGYYKTPEAAAEARRKVVEKVYGDYLNNCEKAPIININIIEDAVINN